MRGLPFKLNAITFRTIYSDTDTCDMRTRASYFRDILQTQTLIKNTVLNYSQHCITSTMAGKLAGHFPQYIPVVRRLMEVKRVKDLQYDLIRSSWGIAPSVHNDFVDFALQLVSTHPRFGRAFQHATVRYGKKTSYEMVHAFLSSWEIPTQRYLDDISKVCGIDLQRNDHRVKHRFSAAAAAISFMQSMPRSTR
jgi:hypothetical protein